MNYSNLKGYLGNLDTLANMGTAKNGEYIEPALKNLGSIAIPIVREIISPASFRNSDTEITDILSHNTRRIRAVANKFKYGERARGLQILRAMGAGGNMAQNKTFFTAKQAISDGFDINTVVFGDSANKEKFVLPVKASTQYSDAISIQPYTASVESSFHIQGAEDGSLWKSDEKKNSDNLFERHFVRPGTLLLQVLTINGKTMPVEALQHLLLSIGSSGAYGGQTSIYGVNVRNHIVGIYASKFERAIASPYEAIHSAQLTEETDAASAVSAFNDIYSSEYPLTISGDDVNNEVSSLIARIETGDETLRSEYQDTANKVGSFFNSWFGFGEK